MYADIMMKCPPELLAKPSSITVCTSGRYGLAGRPVQKKGNCYEKEPFGSFDWGGV
ncbi:hypothetical protein COCC4DRAFT_34584, partial [Bipolaris maydis ATCC 48331]